MIWLRRFLIFALWTGAMLVLLGALIMLFVYGDCMESDAACIGLKDNAARLIPVVVAGIYGIGLGVLLQRWFLNRSHN